MDIDIDNKRKRQEDGNKNPFERTKAMADSPSALNTPATKPVVIPATEKTIKSEQYAALTSQIDEVVNLCKTFKNNMEILNNGQTDIKRWINSQEEKTEINMIKLETGIKNTLNKNNEAFEESINNLGQQTLLTQTQMRGLQQEVQQIQHQQLSQEMNHARTNTAGSGYPHYKDKDPMNKENNNKPITEALRLLGAGTYNGEANEWFEYKLRICNIIEALDLTKEQSIKFVRLSFKGNAVFISENVDINPFLQSMNGEALKQYLQALENLFVGSGNKELARVKFQVSEQAQDESVAMWVSRLRTLYKTAYPNEENFDTNELIKDRFIAGLKSIEQRRYVLTARDLQDDLTKLTQHASKYDAIQVSLKPNITTDGFLTTEKKTQVNVLQSNSFGKRTFNQSGPSMAGPNPRYSRNRYQNNFGQNRNGYSNIFRNGRNNQRYSSNYQRNNFTPRENTFAPRMGYFQRNRYTDNEQNDRGRPSWYRPENNRGRSNDYRLENKNQGDKPTQNYGAKPRNGSFQTPRIYSNRGAMNKGRHYQNNSNRNVSGRGRQHNSFGIIQDTYEPGTIEEEEQESQEI